MSQEIFCDAYGTLVNWSNVIDHCKNSIRHEKKYKGFKGKTKSSKQTLCTATKIESTLPNVVGQSVRPKDKI